MQKSPCIWWLTFSFNVFSNIFYSLQKTRHRDRKQLKRHPVPLQHFFMIWIYVSESVEKYHHAFEDSDFYLLLETRSEEKILKALDLITAGKVDVTLTSYQEGTKGWTYLHYVVDKYISWKKRSEEKSRLMIRAIYRLALAGIDVNARCADEETALVKASISCDQSLMAHMIRIGE